MAQYFLLFILSLSSLFATNIPDGSVYLEGSSDSAIILAHGKGKGPTYKVVNPLRLSINKDLGFHTLSLQMPNQKEKFTEYASDFPKAYEIINQAIAFLQEKGVKNIYLIGHSMGSRMVSSFLSKNPDIKSIDGLIILGCRNGGGEPFNCKQNVTGLTLPILDMWGEKEDKDSTSAFERKNLQSEHYQQISIKGANHRFDGAEEALVDNVKEWLKSFKR